MTKREQAREKFQQALREGEEGKEALWEALTACQGETFYTSKGLEYTYTIRTRHDGLQSGEMFISRKEKSITQSSVFMAFQRALEQKGDVAGPKKLGTFGASYLYPIFLFLGIIHEKGELSPAEEPPDSQTEEEAPEQMTLF